MNKVVRLFAVTAFFVTAPFANADDGVMPIVASANVVPPSATVPKLEPVSAKGALTALRRLRHLKGFPSVLEIDAQRHAAHGLFVQARIPDNGQIDLAAKQANINVANLRERQLNSRSTYSIEAIAWIVTDARQHLSAVGALDDASSARLDTEARRANLYAAQVHLRELKSLPFTSIQWAIGDVRAQMQAAGYKLNPDGTFVDPARQCELDMVEKGACQGGASNGKSQGSSSEPAPPKNTRPLSEGQVMAVRVSSVKLKLG